MSRAFYPRHGVKSYFIPTGYANPKPNDIPPEIKGRWEDNTALQRIIALPRSVVLPNPD